MLRYVRLLQHGSSAVGGDSTEVSSFGSHLESSSGYSSALFVDDGDDAGRGGAYLRPVRRRHRLPAHRSLAEDEDHLLSRPAVTLSRLAVVFMSRNSNLHFK